MTRRLQMAGVGLCAFLFPACMGNNQPTDPYYTGPGVVLMNRNPAVPASRLQPPRDNLTNDRLSVLPPADSKFGPIVPVAAVAVNPLPSGSISPKEITITELPMPYDRRPVKVQTPLPADPIKLPPDLASPLSQTAPAAIGFKGTYPSGDPLIVPKWPNLGGEVVGPNAIKPPAPLPKFDAQAIPLLDLHEDPQPVLDGKGPPISTQPLVVQPASGTSMKVQEPAPILPPISVAPTASSTNAVHAIGNDTQLILAIKAFQNNRPDEALERLKQLDSTNQELLMYLMPLMVRLGEGNLNPMPPDEMAMLIDRLQTASSMLKSKAALGADHVCFCRGVRKFADVDPYEARHEFRPGDMVFLYAELKNFTCEPVNAAQQRQGSAIAAQRGFSIRLITTLELRDARNGLIWRTDLPKNDFAQSPPQDYYHTYRFCVPEKLPAGAYTLWLNVTDKPTGRTIRKPVEMRVGQS